MSESPQPNPWRFVSAVLLIAVFVLLGRRQSPIDETHPNAPPSTGDWLIVVSDGLTAQHRIVLDDAEFFRVPSDGQKFGTIADTEVHWRHITNKSDRFSALAKAAKSRGVDLPAAVRLKANGTVVKVIPLPTTSTDSMKKMMGI